MPIKAPTRQTPARTPISHDAHGIVPFHRRGSRSLDDKQSRDGGGSGGGGIGRGDGSNNGKFCAEFKQKLFNDKNQQENTPLVDSIYDFLVDGFREVSTSVSLLKKFMRHNKHISTTLEYRIEYTQLLIRYYGDEKLYVDGLTAIEASIKEVISRCNLSSDQLSKLEKILKDIEDKLRDVENLQEDFPMPIDTKSLRIKFKKSKSISVNRLNLVSQTPHLSNNLVQKLINFISPTSQKQTKQQVYDEIMVGQRAEIERRKRQSSYNPVDQLIYYAPTLMNILRNIPVAIP